MKLISLEEAKDLYAEEFFNSLDESTRIGIWNDYCERGNNNDTIYNMSEIDILEPVEGLSISEILSKFDKDFDEHDTYFYYDGYGDICSTDDADDVIEYFDLRYWFPDNLDEDDFIEWLADEHEVEIAEDEED